MLVLYLPIKGQLGFEVTGYEVYLSDLNVGAMVSRTFDGICGDCWCYTYPYLGNLVLNDRLGSKNLA